MRQHQMLESASEKLARMMTATGVKVVFDPRVKGPMADLQSEAILMPPLPEKLNATEMAYLHGALDHEAAHLLFTKTKDGKMADKTSGFVGVIENALEDGRINRLMGERFIGSQDNLRDLYEASKTKLAEVARDQQRKAGGKPDPKRDEAVAALTAALKVSVRHVWKRPDVEPFIGTEGDAIVATLPDELRRELEAIETIEDVRAAAPKVAEWLKLNRDEKRREAQAEKQKAEKQKGQKGESGEGGESDEADESGEGTSGKSKGKPKASDEGDEADAGDGEGEGADGGEGEEQISANSMDGWDDEDEAEEGQPKPKKSKAEKAEKGEDGEGEDSDAAGEGAEGPDGDEEGDGDAEAASGANEGAEGERGGQTAKAEAKERVAETEFTDKATVQTGHGHRGAESGATVAEDIAFEKATAELNLALQDAIKASLPTVENFDGGRYNGSNYTVDTSADAELSIHELVKKVAADHGESTVRNGIENDAKRVFKDYKTMVGPLRARLVMDLQSTGKVWTRDLRSGRLLDTSALARPSVGDARVFKHKRRKDAVDTCVTMLIDCSGSMMGSKIDTALQLAALFVDALEMANVPCEVLGFTTFWDGRHPTSGMRHEPVLHIRFKERHERLQQVRDQWVVAKTMMNSNVDGEAVQWAAKRIAVQREQRKILMVLSDGLPAAGMADDCLNGHLRDTVKRVQAAGIEVVGIGIQNAAVKRFYPRNVVYNRLDEFMTGVYQTISGLLRTGKMGI